MDESVERLAQMPRFSLVVPVYQEEENVRALYERVCETLSGECANFELIYVDDGSTDRTACVVDQIRQRDPRVRCIAFRRNRGQTAAMWAGIQHARGRAIVTMDGDLQNDPADIPRMLARLDEGFDVVVGWRRDRHDPFCSRILPSKVANWLIGKIIGTSVHDSGCSLKVYRSTIIKGIPLYSEMHRFIPALVASAGASIAEVVVQHHPRRRGKSKYGLSRLGKVLLDVITVKMLITCGERPMHWFAGFAAPFWLLTFIAAAATAWNWGEQTGVVLPLLMLLLAYISVYLTCIGLLAEMILRARR